MKLQLANSDGRNVFTASGDDYVSVNAIRHTKNVLVLPDQVIPAWTQGGFDTLGVSEFELLAALDTEIILLGTGNQIRFPRPELLQPLMRAHKGLEVMDVRAACRTFNVLVSEGRKVAAALILS